MPEHRLPDAEFAEELLARTAGQYIADELDEEIEKLLADETVELPSEERMLRLGTMLLKEEKSAQNRRCFAVWAKKAGKYAASIAAVLVLAATVSFHTVASARESIATLFLRNFGEYSKIYTENSTPLGKPFGWTYEYYPTQLPEKYVFDQMKLPYGHGTLFYQNEHGDYLLFSCLSKNDKGYNSEDRTAEIVQIGHYPGFLFLGNEPRSKVLVIYADVTIVITGVISYDDLIDFANTVYGLS